ncbi:MAG: CHASE2 domain-containing protein [Nitrospirae bacterium]|nr:CHASE2 domain-containing protein [Nitrospirota bacterium]
MKRPSKQTALVALAVACALLGFLASETSFLRTLEFKTLDLRFRLLGDQGAASADIVLVAIDDASLKTLEPAVGRWPWPRDAHSVLLGYLQRAGARLVVFDLLFLERDAQNPDGDATFAEATEQAGNVVHSVHLGNQQIAETPSDLLTRASIPSAGGFDSFAGIDFPLEGIARGATSLGHVAMALDQDGPWRRYLLLAGHEGRLLPSIALSSALASEGIPLDSLRVEDREVQVGEAEIPLDTDWRLPIWFNGGPGTYRKYPYGQLFYSELQLREGQEPGLDPDLFADKIVIVGLSAAGLHDIFTTPYSGGRGEPGEGLGKMHGFEIHANVIDDLLHGRFLQAAPAWQCLGVVLLVASVTVGLTLYTGLVTALTGAAIVPLVYLSLVHWGFSHRYQLPVVSVMLSWALALTAGLVYQYWVESAEKRKVKRIFSRYVSPDVYQELLDNPNAASLGGTRREMSVLFSDLRGFTTFSEGRSPEEVIEQLNEYFAAMVEVVFTHRGTVDKFVGDMIMALFGAPLEDADHADNAVRCALAMQQSLARLNKTWRNEGRPELASGIGINSGEMVAGNLGSEKIQSYTVIGDNVNLGARIESLCKEFHAEILTSELTEARLTGDYSLEELGEVTVKGKTRPVKIFRVPLG